MTALAAPARGHVEEGWGKVADAFRANFEGNPGEVGAACCVYVDGRPVVDLWGGFADREANRPWDEDTIAAVASTTKGATAICAASAGPARRARSRRPRGRVLAGVRRCRQGADPGALAALAPGRPAGHRHTADVRGRLRLASGHPRPRGAEAAVAAGHGAPVPRAHLRVPRRRGRSADHRQVARHLLRRRGRCSARAARLDRAARGAGGTGGPDHVRPVHSRGADRRDDRSHRPRCGHGHRLDRGAVQPRARSPPAPASSAAPSIPPATRATTVPSSRRSSPPRTWSRTRDRWPGCMRPR